MERAKKVIDGHDLNHPDELRNLEGRVKFSDSKITEGGFRNLTLKLEGNDDEFWLREEHRIDVG